MNRPTFVAATLGDLGASAYYRIETPLLSTRQAGKIQVRFPDKMQFFPIEMLQVLKPDTLVFHRSHTMDQIKYLNHVTDKLPDVLKVYAVDDWVGKVPKYSPHYKDVYKGIDKDIKKAVDKCDKLIVTNDLLANVYGYKKDTYIVPTYLSEVVWQDIYKQMEPIPQINSSVPRIGWSGGIGHAGDLEILREVADILGDKVHWVFLGGDIPKGFNESNCEIHVSNKGPGYYGFELHKLQLDLGLIPLVDNEFNRAKCNIRILEYAACGFPIIASNVKPYKDSPVTLLEYNAKWWAESILKKLEDREALKAEGQALKSWLWENYKMEDYTSVYADILSPDGQGFVPASPEIIDIVDIIVTTHNHKDVVEQCVNSVLDSVVNNKTKIELIVSDNASTDADMVRYLDELESKVSVIRLPKDLGYVKNINHVIELHPDRDVITLNSDTTVNGDWIDRLKTACYQDERICSSTPLSNNATLLSYPSEKGTDITPGLVKIYDAVASESAYKYTAIPSSIGFANYIKRKALGDLGLFDANAFGRGYGEENDWSMRALERGWVSVAALDTYVGHAGAATFQGERESLLKNALGTVGLRWPMYGKILEQWGQAQPLRYTRQSMDLAVIKHTNDVPRTLHITHMLGGGIETFINNITKNSNDVIARFDTPQPGFMTFSIINDTYFNLPVVHMKTAGLQAVVDLLYTFNINKIYVHTTLAQDFNFPQWLINLAKLADIPYDVMIHDYWMLCPRLRLVQDNNYCGMPESVTDCNNCVIKYGSYAGQVDVSDWRILYNRFLQNASNIYAPSQDVIARFNKYYQVNIEYRPHETDPPIKEFDTSLDYKDGDLIRVGVIGYIFNEKGSLVIEECAKYCKEYNIPLKFTIFGSLLDTTSNPPRKIEENDHLFITGDYKEEDLNATMQVNKCHISFLPAIWPETYSYTLSHAMRAGLYPVVFDLGAPAERVKSTGFGEVIPLELSKNPEKLVNALMDVAKRIRG